MKTVCNFSNDFAKTDSDDNKHKEMQSERETITEDVMDDKRTVRI